MMHILIVEDDPEIAAMVTFSLRRAGYRVSFAANAKRTFEVLEQDPPELILLDLMLPGMNGLQITERIRGTLDIPIVMLTALSETDDKVIGLQAGADDYVSKPFSTQELIARIEAVLRRAKHAVKRPRDVLYCFNGWTMNPVSRELLNPEKVRILLTSAEYDLLRVLCSNAGSVMSRDKLMRLSQGREVEPYDRSIDTLISRIRQKIENEPDAPEIIKTVRNGGYLFAVAVDEIAL